MTLVIRRCLAIAVVSAYLCSFAAIDAEAVPVPRHAYNFNGNLADTGTGGVAITSEGGTLTSSLYTFDPTLSDLNQGLTLQTPALSNAGVYSIEMYLKYDTVSNISTTRPPYWIKLVDYKNATVDLGTYYEDMAFSTRFDANPATPGISSLFKQAYNTGLPGPPGVAQSGSVMTPNSWLHLVTTRDALGEVTGYVNGSEVYSFIDTLGNGIFSGPNNIMRFLQGDTPAQAGSYFEVAKGAIDFLNIYNEALSPADVSSLAAAVPEPTSLALVSLASSVVLLRRCRAATSK